MERLYKIESDVVTSSDDVTVDKEEADEETEDKVMDVTGADGVS